MLSLQKSRSGVAFPLEDQNVKREVTISHQTEGDTAAHPKALWPSRAEGHGSSGNRGAPPHNTVKSRPDLRAKGWYLGWGFFFQLINSVDCQER